MFPLLIRIIDQFGHLLHATCSLFRHSTSTTHRVWSSEICLYEKSKLGMSWNSVFWREIEFQLFANSLYSFVHFTSRTSIRISVGVQQWLLAAQWGERYFEHALAKNAQYLLIAKKSNVELLDHSSGESTLNPFVYSWVRRVFPKQVEPQFCDKKLSLVFCSLAFFTCTLH